MLAWSPPEASVTMRRRSNADIDSAAEVGFLLDADGRFPVIDAGIAAAALPADPHLVWNALRKLALEFH